MFAVRNHRFGPCGVCGKVHYYMTFKCRVVISDSRRGMRKIFPSEWKIKRYDKSKCALPTMTVEEFFKEQGVKDFKE